MSARVCRVSGLCSRNGALRAQGAMHSSGAVGAVSGGLACQSFGQASSHLPALLLTGSPQSLIPGCRWRLQARCERPQSQRLEGCPHASWCAWQSRLRTGRGPAPPRGRCLHAGQGRRGDDERQLRGSRFSRQRASAGAGSGCLPVVETKKVEGTGQPLRCLKPPTIFCTRS